MIGYHYTTWKNWQKIQKQGLKPKKITRTELVHLFGHSPKGVWVWKKRFHGIAHVGSILYQVAMKNNTKIVHLQLVYDRNDELTFKGQRVQITHDGNIENLQYHNSKTETSCLLKKNVPPEQIKLLKVYDLVELLQ